VLRSDAMFPPTIRVTEVGDTARRVIEAASSATVVASLSRSVYLEVAGQIVWLGPTGSTPHRRVIVSPDALDAGGARHVETSFDLRAAREWRPPSPPAVDGETLAHESRRLVDALERLDGPDGFGALLIGRRPGFPLDRATEDAHDFIRACARGEASAAASIGQRLLGLGPGLTPAGDDLVGGAFFARRLLGDWSGPAAAIRARARERTHAISATLLGDLLDGSGHAPLHDLALALARSDGAAALDAAGRLVRIGHSSGWDMLTGFLGALGGVPKSMA
jgi:Protein of unknown function (DUF2877)